MAAWLITTSFSIAIGYIKLVAQLSMQGIRNSLCYTRSATDHFLHFTVCCLAYHLTSTAIHYWHTLLAHTWYLQNDRF
jgi:hypothetical protein